MQTIISVINIQKVHHYFSNLGYQWAYRGKTEYADKHDKVCAACKYSRANFQQGKHSMSHIFPRSSRQLVYLIAGEVRGYSRYGGSMNGN